VHGRWHPTESRSLSQDSGGVEAASTSAPHIAIGISCKSQESVYHIVSSSPMCPKSLFDDDQFQWSEFCGQPHFRLAQAAR
jgi:hypothetical protein